MADEEAPVWGTGGAARNDAEARRVYEGGLHENVDTEDLPERREHQGDASDQKNALNEASNNLMILERLEQEASAQRRKKASRSEGAGAEQHRSSTGQSSSPAGYQAGGSRWL